ncbi:carbohydrate kinase family protein [Pseudomonas sp. P154a]|uniref:carbohydrate kinase family protein n=1 Tax=Pseudomonas mucoides TaxID=2730424 RepID=UPI001892433A|nr:carbohydrate kinase family protein [Pseudomonas mucoides]MBF6037920.1 carbohydrate kinase family protein [Pseudomonas mucoides]
MHIVGGLYRELCDVPFWDSTLGSGGRAALAANALASGVEFSTYASPADRSALVSLESQGIITHAATRPSPIVFAYFHPLSSPHIEPPRASINRENSISVTGNAVLRFGFLEGDAVVTANRAVYDPQTWHNPPSFGANGSTARELALVMNELEVRQITGIDELHLAAQHLLKRQRAQVVVIKQGARGASVYEGVGKISHIPAYRSSSVFKIGTGDIFTAVFAVHWAQGELPPHQAADLASRSVSVYCDTRAFEFDESILKQRQPISSWRGGRVRLEGGVDSLGQRYTMEEARFALRELGVDVTCPQIEVANAGWNTDATLVINDELSVESLARIAEDRARSIPIITLHERTTAASVLTVATETTDDFTTAMYLAVWAAGEAAATH